MNIRTNKRFLKASAQQNFSRSTGVKYTKSAYEIVRIVDRSGSLRVLPDYRLGREKKAPPPNDETVDESCVEGTCMTSRDERNLNRLISSRSILEAIVTARYTLAGAVVSDFVTGCDKVLRCKSGHLVMNL